MHELLLELYLIIYQIPNGGSHHYWVDVKTFTITIHLPLLPVNLSQQNPQHFYSGPVEWDSKYN